MINITENGFYYSEHQEMDLKEIIFMKNEIVKIINYV